MARPIHIAVTTGDIDGIGTEIAAKALQKLRPRSGIYFYLWRPTNCPQKYLRRIDSQFERITVPSWPEALKQKPSGPKQLIDISSSLPPTKWVEISAKASQFGHIDAIATAPLSKKGSSSGSGASKKIGHTEILKSVTSKKNVYMAFVGKHFNVLLATPHLSLQKVPRQLTKDVLEKAILSANKLRAVLPKRQMDRPLAVLGLNPHAGESGLLGSEEETIITPVISSLKKRKLRIEGPLAPDSAFLEENWKKYSVFICCYHDQGLIPFKTIHKQDSGVHITMGLPFIRTSVDHGTAKNLFGKDIANSSSMYESLLWAIKLSRTSLKTKKIPTNIS